jgi:prepilin-type N-terminal cleavage/methylation domain-containing protein
MYRFNNNLKRSVTAESGFTLMEVTTALFLLSIILTSVMVLMNRYVDAVMDMRLRQEAFELARSNMETLLTENRLSNKADFGTSELNPAIDWSTIVEPFYEPVTNRMWIRAICTSEFLDSKQDYEEIKLEHWITSLTAAQVKQILAQQEAEDEYMKLLQADELTDIEKTTLAYLEAQGLDVDAYNDFRDSQRRQKIKFLSDNGMNGWERFLETLLEEENEFLEKLGVDFVLYNEFAQYYDPDTYDDGTRTGLPEMETNQTESESSEEDAIDDSPSENEALNALPDELENLFNNI